MSGRRAKRRRREAPMPATGAGLLRFFEEETLGIKIKPEIVLILAICLIAFCFIAQFF
jgi:preprotein translocase subunit Sec61beta